MLLGDDLAIELVLGDLLLGQLLVAPGLERAEAQLDAARSAAVEPHRRARQVFQEAAVVADQHQRRALGGKRAFEPFDGGQIEMVGRLVEQQDVGRRRQHVRERGTPRLAARQLCRVLVAGKPELLQEIARLVGIIAGAQSGLHVGQRRRMAGEIGLLRQVADGGARLHEALAAVGLDQSRRDLEQRRLARAVAPDEADALSRRDGEIDPVEQRRAAEGERDISELKERKGHLLLLLSSLTWIAQLQGMPRRFWHRPHARTRGTAAAGRRG